MSNEQIEKKKQELLKLYIRMQVFQNQLDNFLEEYKEILEFADKAVFDGWGDEK